MKNKKRSNSISELSAIQERASGLIRYFKSEFGDDLHNNKLILKLTHCGKDGCSGCPHGPYWYRAVFNPKTNRWVFKYIKSKITRGLLQKSELRHWERYSFYNREIEKLKKEKQIIRRARKDSHNFGY